MARTARKKSSSNVYHIMLRGINRQSLFESDVDNIHFLKVLRQYKAECGYKIFAYCLMGNHVHLLLQFDQEDISICMKKIAVAYSYYYNCKNMRLGPVFQDRFRSEAVEDDSYLIGVTRYIHRNPLKAGICSSLDDYRWSSYPEYARLCGQRNGVKPAMLITDTDMLLDIQGKNEFIRYSNISNDTEYLELDETVKRKLSDESARALLKEKTNLNNIAAIQAATKPQQKEVILFLKSSGANIAQISRLTGISRATVMRVEHGDGSDVQ